MNKLISHIQATLKEILLELYKIEISIDDLSLENPPKKELGDYAFPCFWLSKLLKKWPAQIGQEIIDYLKNNEKYDIFSNLEVAWPYLNLRLDKEFLSKFFIENYTDLLNLDDKNNNWKTIVIDYIWANVWKPLHIGHMCTPNQWQVLINLFEKIGYNVISDSHIWDWGIIFGKLIYAYKNLWWDEKKLKENAVEHLFELYVNISNEIEKDKQTLTIIWNECLKLDTNILKEKIKMYFPDYFNNHIKCINQPNLPLETFPLHNYSWAYVILSNYFFSDWCNEHLKKLQWIFPKNDLEYQIRNEFKLLSEWNTESIELWQKFTKYSIDSMQKTLDRFNIKPDYNIWESFYEGLWFPKMENYPDLTYDMKQIVAELLKKWIATKNDDGSVWVVFPDDTKIPSCILQKRDWTHGYLASDLAWVKYRMQNWNPEKIIYFVDVRQQLHLKQVFTISKMAGWSNDKTELFHVYNWFISLKDGAMSTRKWRIIKLEALLDEAELRAKKIISEKRDDFTENELTKLSKIIWIWAIKYGYLSKNRTLDTIFDWDEFMTFEWNSWPYIQYAYVRAMQILEKANYPVIARNEAIQKIWNNIVNGLLHKNSQWQKDTIDNTFDHDEEIDLAKELFNYKSILAETATSYYPHILCNYAYNLTKKFNSFYNKVHILSEENEAKKQLKLLLVDQFSQVLKNSFEILWIEMPEKM